MTKEEEEEERTAITFQKLGISPAASSFKETPSGSAFSCARASEAGWCSSPMLTSLLYTRYYALVLVTHHDGPMRKVLLASSCY